MKTREELDDEWFALQVATGHPSLVPEFRRLITAERAFVDRAMQVRAIRWACSPILADTASRLGLKVLRAVEVVNIKTALNLADALERGETTIPEEP